MDSKHALRPFKSCMIYTCVCVSDGGGYGGGYGGGGGGPVLCVYVIKAMCARALFVILCARTYQYHRT